MIVVVSDTHAEERPGLAGRTAEAVREADTVVHAGDFVTEAVLDGFESISRRFLGVHGNADEPAVVDRLPAATTFERGGLRFAVTHRQRGGETGLRFFGRERDADVVVFGHTHRPHVDRSGTPVLLNPGSHADPRGSEPTHLELSERDGGISVAVRTEKGAVRTGFDLEGHR
ncbi:MAG: metallophosphoesterase [Halodesulfurarchaeum sp.]